MNPDGLEAYSRTGLGSGGPPFDSMMELVVASDDGLVHTYDFPGAAVEWSMPSGNPARTGWVPVPSSRPAPPEGDSQPQVVGLNSVGPNPATATVSLSFQLPTASPVQIDVFDASGRRVRRLVDRVQFGAGFHQLNWDGRGDGGNLVGAGAYFVRVALGNAEFTRKIVRTQ